MHIQSAVAAGARALGKAQLAFTLSLAVLAGPALCDVVTLQGTPTTMTSTADRMISYRCQSHSWQTADGATHLMVNRGPGRVNKSLLLYSTFDGGATWVSSGVALPGSNGSTTSDGYMVGNRLYVTYDSGTGTIKYAELNYDPSTRTWAMGEKSTVFDSSTAVALTPSLAVDTQSRQWLTFTYQDTATGNFSIKLMRKGVTDQVWKDTGLIFGAVDNIANERSGRPIATANGMGVVYTVHADTFWAERKNDAPIGSEWASTLVSTKLQPLPDPYGSHFSVVTDSAFNVHLLSVDGGQVVYSRLLAGDGQAWSTRTITPDIKATYLQATIVDDKLTVVTNTYSNLSVYQSNDNGQTFDRTHALTHALPTGQQDFSRPRVETPSYATNPIPVLQQFTDGKKQHLLFFAVDAQTGVAKPGAAGR